jgi:hypothetical protein
MQWQMGIRLKSQRELMVSNKTQMGTTLSSCSHFVVFELLHPRRQATVMWLAAFASASCLRVQLLFL